MKKIKKLILVTTLLLLLPLNVNASTLLRDMILNNNEVRSGATFNKSVVSQETFDSLPPTESFWYLTQLNSIVENGLFRATDDHGEAFFFRGAYRDINNNVIFAGHQWKILRIEGNGNIRLIYNGICPNNECAINTPHTEYCEYDDGEEYCWYEKADPTDFTIGESVFSSQFSYEDALSQHHRYIGYMFGSQTGNFNEQHANVNDSTIKTFVDNWFNNSSNIPPSARSMIVNDTIFCADRTIGSPETHCGDADYCTQGTGMDSVRSNTTIFGASERFYVNRGGQHYYL